MQYVELHCHSNFSFLDGAAHPEELITRAEQLGYPALAITDHNALYGVVRFHQQAKKSSIKPIYGSEITLENNHHLLLLIKNETGYANLSQLLSVAGLDCEKGKAKIPFDLLDKYHEGLIALSGCTEGEIPSLLLNDEPLPAARAAATCRELFGYDNFFLELQHHNLPAHQFLCEQLTRLGRQLDMPTVATNNVHYTHPEGRMLQDVLTCIKHLTNLDEAGQLLYPNAERYLKPPEAMIKRFAHYPEAISNSVAIAERCTFSLDQLKTSLPDVEVPYGKTSAGYLRYLTYRGARERYDELTKEVTDQLDHELRIITKLNLEGFFLIVDDIARFCKESKVLSQGRGSAANSAVCYCLGITAVDPIGLKLLFERFLSEERTEPPDIDIDIANNRREEVIQYVYNKYGRQHAAMVCEFITYKRRSAARDVGKALGFSLEEVDRLAKLLDHFTTPEEIIDRVKEARMNVDNKRVRLLLDLMGQIKRFPRHLGIHVGGMIITKKPLSQIVPIENATMPDRSVIQWDKDDVNALGMTKIDLLGLGMLSLIDYAIKLIEKHHGITIDPAQLDYNDPLVYDLICRAETVGVFQVESRAQMNTLPRHRPRRFYDLVVEVALIRPGPIQGKMVHPYLRRRNGEEAITYPHPSLEQILKRTLGIPLFQEQGMQVAITAAGFTPTQADELRRAMGHKRSRLKMEALSSRLIDGMIANGIDQVAAENIFKQLAAFADFGFAESHAASFALLVYVSSYLKVYYPSEFYCSLLNAQPMGFYRPSTIVYEAKRRNVEIKNVDITKSRWDCTVEEGAVRLGLRYVRHIGNAVKEEIEAAIDAGPFLSIRDFVFRMKLNSSALEQLTMIDAFACFGLDRRQALWELLSILRDSPEQLPLTTVETGRQLLEPMNIAETLSADFRGTGLSTDRHPMNLVRATLKQRKILAAVDLNDIPSGRLIVVAGVVIIRQRPHTAKGFLFITLEDETGFANIVVKPNVIEHFRKEVVHARALIVKGTVEKRDGVINVIGRHFQPLHFTAETTQLKDLNDKEIAIRSRDFR